MILILGLILVAVLAYFLARRDFDKNTVEASRGLTVKAKEIGGDLQGRVKSATGQGQGKPEDFIAWAEGSGKKDLPEDFNSWFAGLNDQEKKSFSKALANYADSLGMSLAALSSGRLDSQPDFKSVFVETLVIYSSAYRKIAEAKTKSADEDGKEDASKDQPAEGEIKPAEKARSRRSPDSTVEAAPAVS